MQEPPPTDRPPTVSVIIPAYNAADFVGDAIASVLGQTWADLECIVVDDGSTDATATIAADFDDRRVRLLRKENRGTVADARNAGIEAANGRFLAFLDADDVWLPEKLHKQITVLEERPEVGLVHCVYAITDQDLSVLTLIWPDPKDISFERWLLLEGNGIAPSSTLVRREVVDRVGRFRLELSVSEDCDFFERIASDTTIASLDECLALYRTHPAQGHRQLDRFEHDVEWILRDRFGDGGGIDRKRWRRGRANLHVRLFVYGLRATPRRNALGHLRTALAMRPSRLVLLPIEATIRRFRRTRRLRQSADQLSRIRTFVQQLRATRACG